MFPITDSSGRVIAFTGRILKDDGQSAKYLNSPETPIFNKSQILFGLDKAKTEIRRLGYSIWSKGRWTWSSPIKSASGTRSRLPAPL